MFTESFTMQWVQRIYFGDACLVIRPIWHVARDVIHINKSEIKHDQIVCELETANIQPRLYWLYKKNDNSEFCYHWKVVQFRFCISHIAYLQFDLKGQQILMHNN